MAGTSPAMTPCLWLDVSETCSQARLHALPHSPAGRSRLFFERRRNHRARRSFAASIRAAQPCCRLARAASRSRKVARVVLSVLTRKDVAVISSLAPLTAWRPIGLWVCGQCKSVAHKPHRPNSNRKSGQMMCYKPRTSSRATDTGGLAAGRARCPSGEPLTNTTPTPQSWGGGQFQGSRRMDRGRR